MEGKSSDISVMEVGRIALLSATTKRVRISRLIFIYGSLDGHHVCQSCIANLILAHLAHSPKTAAVRRTRDQVLFL